MPSRLAEPCRLSPLAFTSNEITRYMRVVAERNAANKDCCRELYFGFFFDGTNNNADLRRTDNPSVQSREAASDREKSAHSNVARLLDVFPDNKYVRECFGRYAPGVGTRFDDIGDTGAGDDVVVGSTDRRRGLAFGQMGEARIVWGLLQALNNVHQYIFDNDTLLPAPLVKHLANTLTTDTAPVWQTLAMPGMAGVRELVQLRAIINAKRASALKELTDRLDRKVRPLLKRKPEVKRIRVSIFGFSRGAAQARGFTNYFVDMCTAASGHGGMALAGIPVQIDFVGIFDTVASVGLANSTIIADGHMGWADAEHALRIPAQVKRCVHLVSAHEIRRSFPLDSIRVQHGYASEQHLEVVYPGVHSDVGGGYLPMEHGRGTDPKGHDMLSRVPLAEMYREARLAGVPLDVDATDKGVTAAAKEALTVAPGLIKAFNDYVGACTRRDGRLEDIFREQTEMQVRWRRLRLDSMNALASVRRASAQDRADLLNANEELRQEVSLLETPRVKTVPNPVAVAVPTLMIADFFLRKTAETVDAIDKRGLDETHYAEWRQLRPAWNAGHPPAAVAHLFENYIHDSRACFKPTADDEHIWRKKHQDRWNALEKQDQRWNEYVREFKQASRAQGGTAPYGMAAATPLTGNQKAELARYRKDGIPLQPDGREPYLLGAGYMRFRQIYFGADKLFIVTGRAGRAGQVTVYKEVSPYAVLPPAKTIPVQSSTRHGVTGH